MCISLMRELNFTVFRSQKVEVVWNSNTVVSFLFIPLHVYDIAYNKSQFERGFLLTIISLFRNN